VGIQSLVTNDNTMNKIRKRIIKKQVELQQQLQKAGFNIVSCGDCGQTLIHKIGKHTIRCVCNLEKVDLSNCPDVWYLN
jgi:hypothetical protein